VLREIGLTDQIDTISLAKQHVLNGPRQRNVVKSEERVFIPNRKDPIVLKQNSNALFLLVRIRDEAHRFAITYNRELRRRARLRTILADIEGIGPVKARALLRYFGSLKRIRAASEEELAQVKGINRELAAAVRRDLDAMTPVLDSEEREEESARKEADAGELMNALPDDGAAEGPEESGEAAPASQPGSPETSETSQ